MKNKTGIFLMIIGAVLISSALFLLLYNQYEDERAGKTAEVNLAELKQSGEIEEHNEKAFKIINGMKVVEINGQEYIGYITIPTLDLQLPVMAEWDYAKLKIAPCRQNGSLQEHNLVIAGHNYKRHFGKLSHLQSGEKILFTDVMGETMCYTVGYVEVLKPNQGEQMLHSEWDLTLYTCTFGGKARTTVRASLDY